MKNMKTSLENFNFTLEETKIITFALNNFGSPHTPICTEESFNYYTTLHTLESLKKSLKKIKPEHIEKLQNLIEKLSNS